MRSVVLIHGLLSGMGYEQPCEMLAMKESVSGTPRVIFTHCSVIDAPQELPDGSYTVRFNDYVVSAKKEGGLWMPTEDAVAMQTDPQLAEEIEETGEILSRLKRLRGRVA